MKNNRYDLSIITVTYNSEKFIENYLDSVKKYLPPKTEVIIVDNNSHDQTREIINKYNFVNIVLNNINVGFSKACNIGAKKASGEYLLFLNPDVTVLDDGINKLLAFAKTIPSLGIASGKVIEPSNKVQQTVKKFPSLKGAIREYWFGKQHEYSQYAPNTKNAVEVECVYGAVMLMTKKLFDQLHGFDERYFLYYEDLDLCKRTKEQRYSIIYYPGAQFSHLVGASTTPAKRLPIGLRTLANFYPFKQTGSLCYQIISGNIYHGWFTAFLIRLIIFLGLKLRTHEKI